MKLWETVQIQKIPELFPTENHVVPEVIMLNKFKNVDSNWIFRLLAEPLATSVTQLYSGSFSEEKVPEQWKPALLVEIY